jgi:hypothetical protein
MLVCLIFFCKSYCIGERYVMITLSDVVVSSLRGLQNTVAVKKQRVGSPN